MAIKKIFRALIALTFILTFAGFAKAQDQVNLKSGEDIYGTVHWYNKHHVSYTEEYDNRKHSKIISTVYVRRIVLENGKTDTFPLNNPVQVSRRLIGGGAVMIFLGTASLAGIGLTVAGGFKISDYNDAPEAASRKTGIIFISTGVGMLFAGLAFVAAGVPTFKAGLYIITDLKKQTTAYLDFNLIANPLLNRFNPQTSTIGGLALHF